MSQTAKIVQKFDEEFNSESPAFTVELVSSNPNVQVEIESKSPFSISFSLVNTTSNHQLVSGSAGDLKENLVIFGKTLHTGSQSKVTSDAGGNRSNIIEVESQWIHDKATAEKIAQWISNRLSKERLKLSLTLMGTPVLEIGDIIAVYHHDIKMSHRKEFVVNSIDLQWDSGLETTVGAVEL